MGASRKRGRQEMEAAEAPKEPGLLERIRNMWEFANLVQWIFIFGRVVKIDENLDIEDLEMECLKHHSTLLPEIGLALLKFVSSHRGLTPELFDEYTRRQYVAKAPERNPFGIEEEPAKFAEFDVFIKIRVLQQLTLWTLGNPDRIRDKMEEQKDSEQTIWRIEPFGWDSDDRTYFLLDDNRLYRRTDPPPPPVVAKPKKNSKKAKAALRASKRRKMSEPADDESDPGEGASLDDLGNGQKDDDTFGGMKWECIAVTLDELNAFIASIAKSRDPNEKILRSRLTEDLLPLLEKQEEARKRKAAQKERELLNLEKLATAKRSSRIAGKLEHQKQEEEAREAERKRVAELALAKKEQERMLKLEKERESRMITREQRLKEREARRILHEEELANLSEDNKKLEAGQGRLSERHLKAEIERKKQALEELAEEEDWIFDCICGTYGQVDDGTHSIACEKCNIWQHSKCVGVSQEAAERDDFHFICNTCQRRAKDAERAKNQPPIKIKFNVPGSASTSPAQPQAPPAVAQPVANGGQRSEPSPRAAASRTMQPHFEPAQIPPSNGPQVATWRSPYAPQTAPAVVLQNNGPQPTPGSSEKPTFSASAQGVSATPYGRPGDKASRSFPPYMSNTSPHPPSVSKGPSAHAFSSPHPYSPTNLPPPVQHQSYSFVNGNSANYGPSALAAPRSHGSPVQNDARLPPIQASPSPAAPQRYGVSTPSKIPAAHPPTPIDGSDRRNSATMLHALGTPLSTPVSKPQPAANLPPLSSPFVNATPSSHSSGGLLPQPPSSVGTKTPHYEQSRDAIHATPNHSVATGLSPTKHSPPRPMTSNGRVASTTTSVLPPIALSPSPQHQNLTPPVKSSEPDRKRESGHNISP